MTKTTITIDRCEIPAYEFDTVIVGSGAASLNCADHLFTYGHRNIAVVTEKIGGGTSNNTGSDKQTYYKLSVSGDSPDSPHEMARALFDGGSMHGDLALIEATMSVQEFFHLVQIGVQFPHNVFGGFVGYKTDHDPRQRATSAGPWTSSQMFRCLYREVERKNIPVFDGHDVIALLSHEGSVVGLLAMDKDRLDTEHFGLCFFKAGDIVFGVGGPGGLYRTSVYPKIQIGAIGLALEIGAVARNLTESQYGLSSIKFRWNVSGTYQQVLPRYISTDGTGGDEREFLNDYFPDMGTLVTDIFLKGYQWPFDPRKIPNFGSSLIDFLVYIETVRKKRRVYLDFTQNPRGDDRLGRFAFDGLSAEAYEYLGNSGALLGTPIERLERMNPLAIELYAKNGIDLRTEPLEVAVCAQHNNGGLAGNIWWESNIRGLYPVGEVNGSHGVYRPGGAALNSGQVGSLRAAQRIAFKKQEKTIQHKDFEKIARKKGSEFLDMLRMFSAKMGENTAVLYRDEFQERMTNHASHIRSLEEVNEALERAYEQISRFDRQSINSRDDIPFLLQNRHLVLAHAAYLEAIRAYLDKGGGSRGSYLVMDVEGVPVLDKLGEKWRYKPEVVDLREQIVETVFGQNGRFYSTWNRRRPIPEEESWFESVWRKFLEGEIFETGGEV